MKPAGIILAAGESSRMGRDKALLPYRGTTFLNHLVAVFAPRVEPLIVVVGHHADPIRASLPAATAVQVVVNPNYREGMLTSLQAGLRIVTGRAEAVLFTLVDHPAVDGSTLDRLIEEFRVSRKAIAIPRHGGRRGHPVLLARVVAEEILALPGDSSAKNVIHAHAADTLFVDVDDAGVVNDIDLPADYERLVED